MPKDAATRERRDEVLLRLQQGICSLTTTDAWQAWLRVQSRFWRYSAGNCLLIAQQRPDATQVAGFQQWQRLGRHVRAGEVGVRILAPCRRLRPLAEAETTTEREVAVVGFRVASVFDVTQTEGRALPALPIGRVHGEDPADCFLRLRQYAATLGYRTELGDFPSHDTCGETDFRAQRITVRRELPPAHRVKTLLHELAHVAMHRDIAAEQRGQAELEAESVAWICCEGIGIAADGYSFAYCAAWGGGGEAATQQIRESAQHIQRTAQRLLEVLVADVGLPASPAAG